MMQKISLHSKLEEKEYPTTILKVWRGYQVRRNFISDDLRLLSKLFLKNCPDLENLPKASSGSAPVYFSLDLPVVFKQCGEKKGKIRFQTMVKVNDLCKRKNYKYLKVPRAFPYQGFIIEERLPILETKQKEQIALYSENKDKFSSAIKEFTKLLCYTSYPDILTSVHPYQKNQDIPLCRYDNIPFFLEDKAGKIGLIDLEDVEIKEGVFLSEEQILDVAKKSLLLFPLHFEEIQISLMEQFPEKVLDFKNLQKYHEAVLSNFNKIYLEHRNFIEKKGELSFPFISNDRKYQIKTILLNKLRLKSFSLLYQFINQIESYLTTNSRNGSNKILSRTLSIPVKHVLANKEEELNIYSIILEELEKGGEICYSNFYFNISGEQFIRIHC